MKYVLLFSSPILVLAMNRAAPLDGDVDRSSTLIGVSWTLATLATIFVSLRFYSRIFITRNPWWDDWAILLTLVS